MGKRGDAHDVRIQSSRWAVLEVRARGGSRLEKPRDRRSAGVLYWMTSISCAETDRSLETTKAEGLPFSLWCGTPARRNSLKKSKSLRCRGAVNLRPNEMRACYSSEGGRRPQRGCSKRRVSALECSMYLNCIESLAAGGCSLCS